MNAAPNHAASGTGAITSLFHAGCQRRGVPEPPRWAALNMRRILCILLGVGGMLIAGCTSDRMAKESMAFDAERQRRLAEVASVEVPFPQTTPYDANGEARQAYLDYYQDGYRMGLTGYLGTCCLMECPNRSTRIDGFYAGQTAGWSVWAKKNL